MNIHGAMLSGRKVFTDFGEYELAPDETITKREELRGVLAKQYRRWDEDHWAKGAWRGTSRAEFEAIADANEERLRNAPIRPSSWKP